MKKIYTKLMLIAFLILSSNVLRAQYAVTALETGKQNTALARDANGNIYTARFQQAGKYEIVKYTNGTGSPTPICQDIPGDAGDPPYGLAIASNGDVYFSSEMGTGGKITRLNAGNGYAATVVQTGRYFTGLAFDKNGKLNVLEYTGTSYAVVRYDSPSSISSTKATLYGSIKSGPVLSYPTSITIGPDQSIYCNNVFDVDGSNPDTGGIIKLTTTDGTTYTKSDLNTTKYTSALYIDEFNNLYAIESQSNVYKLYKYVNGTGTPTVFYDVAFASSYPFLAYGITAYNNAVYAIDGDNGTAGSRLIKLTPDDVTAPSLPTGFVAAVTSPSTVNLSWTANNVSEGISGYRIYAGTSANPTQLLASVPAGITTYTHSALTPGQQYYYKISAVDVYFNESAKTADVSVTPTKPTITSASYNAATKVLTVNGNNFLNFPGANNDIIVNKFTLTADGGLTRVITAGNVETTAGSFSVTLSVADQVAIATALNKNGLNSTNGTAYNLAAANGWDVGADAGLDIAQAIIPVSVTNVPVPAITSAAYDGTTGKLTVAGTNLLSLFGSANDIVATKFRITGEGGASYSLTSTANAEITDANSFTLTIAVADKAAIDPLLNKNGTKSANGTSYNLSAGEDWNAGCDAAVVSADLSGNGIAVSNAVVPLPVSLLAFDAKIQANAVALTWSTASEHNSGTFVVSKSADGKSFKEIGKVKAAGNSSLTLRYSILDKTPNNGINYYKLTEVDNNGAIALEAFADVNFQFNDVEVTVYPNPVADKLNIAVGASLFKTATISDLNGKIVGRYNLQEKTGTSTLNIANLPSGIYLLRLVCNTGQTVKKIVKD